MRSAPGSSYQWILIPDLAWAELAALEAARDKRAAKAPNTRYWRPNPNLPGLAGEWGYGAISDQLMNMTPEIWHDQLGQDFPGVDVKATTNKGNPHLNHGDEQELKSPLYFGALVDLDEHMVKPLGYATRAMLQAAPRHRYRHGEVGRIHPAELLTADMLLSRLLAGLTVDELAEINPMPEAA